MTREEIDAYVGRRARIRRADGVVLVGTIRSDYPARIGVVGTNVARWIRYEHVASIDLVDDSVPNTH